MRIFEDTNQGVWKAEILLDYYNGWKYTAICSFVFVGILLCGSFYNDYLSIRMFYDYAYGVRIEYPPWIILLSSYSIIISPGLYYFLKYKRRSEWWICLIVIPVIGLITLLLLILGKKTFHIN